MYVCKLQKLQNHAFPAIKSTNYTNNEHPSLTISTNLDKNPAKIRLKSRLKLKKEKENHTVC